LYVGLTEPELLLEEAVLADEISVGLGPSVGSGLLLLPLSFPLSERSGAGQVLMNRKSMQILGNLIDPIRLVSDGRSSSRESILGRLNKASLGFELLAFQ
jgi:hypothetical protein